MSPQMNVGGPVIIEWTVTKDPLAVASTPCPKSENNDDEFCYDISKWIYMIESYKRYLYETKTKYLSQDSFINI